MHTNVLSIPAHKRFGRIVPAAWAGLGLHFGSGWLVWIGIMFLATILKAFVPR